MEDKYDELTAEDYIKDFTPGRKEVHHGFHI